MVHIALTGDVLAAVVGVWNDLKVEILEPAAEEGFEVRPVGDSYQPSKMLTPFRRATPHERRRAFALASDRNI